MKRALKTLLLWLLISLFPLQGMAVAMSPPCGTAAAAVDSKHAALEHHAAYCPSQDADASDSTVTHHACSACCIGASAPPSTPVPAAGHSMSEPCFAPPGMPGGGFIPAGLERPPKSIFA